ncbi:hypothetical protein NC653_041159 [Populus alba x Populus x berolinensis]|uniref:Uncharacterized protein n=1 Tax=Populus alba x Populus x berolinensis TaxID=444605 RepID=A0AAD6PQE5_9ROSI|nr:hypothetical protein NC653_041158 [Populus alba x Populus x berolinensis]KAJ6951912.1 hypothetical protein NC653_041159 [Populus alba x Populus x berolinensis]
MTLTKTQSNYNSHTVTLSQSQNPFLPFSLSPFPSKLKNHSPDPERLAKDEDSAILYRQRSIPAKKSLLHSCMNVETPCKL